MTPLAGFVAAVIAGWIIRDPRRAAAAVLVPFLAVLAAQTWILASGRGDNPPSTPHGVSYWVFQAIFLAFALGIATQLASWRRARSAAGDAAELNRRTWQACALLVVLTAAFVTGYLLNSHRVLHHNANSPLPVTGLLGIVACVVGLAVFSVLNLRGRRAAVAAS
jgi:di/tricarboxylate transporter